MYLLTVLYHESWVSIINVKRVCLLNSELTPANIHTTLTQPNYYTACIFLGHGYFPLYKVLLVRHRIAPTFM